MPSFRSRTLLSAVILCLLGLGVVAVKAGMAGAQGSGASLSPQEAATEAQLKAQGQLAYNDRPSDVQAVMQRMYDNDSRYRTLSTLFVDHAPSDVPGSVRIDIAQDPPSVRTAAYADDTGTGVPVEQTAGGAESTLIYAPSANSYFNNPHPAQVKLMPLDSVPLALGQIEYGPTTIFGFLAPQAVLADEFVHPAAIITSTFFRNKVVNVGADTTFAGRSAWELRGTQIPTAIVIPQLGDGWKMWVDKQTGIILRIEYYQGTGVIGWAELRDLSVDGQGPGGNVPPLSVLGSAKRLRAPEYARDVVIPGHRAAAAGRRLP